jgi:hypothetical protein
MLMTLLNFPKYQFYTLTDRLISARDPRFRTCELIAEQKMSGGKACPKCKNFFTWSEYFGHEPMCGQFDKYLQTDAKAQEQARQEKEQKILAEVQAALSAKETKQPTPVTPSYQPQNDYHAFVKPAPERELTGLEKARSQLAVKSQPQVQEEQEVCVEQSEE